jgi:hypothetical protein
VSAIVVTTANWKTDYCPKCGLGPSNEHADVQWHTARRGMCSNGHFIALEERK